MKSIQVVFRKQRYIRVELKQGLKESTMRLPQLFIILFFSLLFGSVSAVASNMQPSQNTASTVSIDQTQLNHCDHCQQCEQMAGHNCETQSVCPHANCHTLTSTFSLPTQSIYLNIQLTAQALPVLSQPHYLNPYFPPLTPPPNL